MHLSPTSRPTRTRRLLAISAAAVAVMIAPTACDYGGYGNGSATDDLSNTGDMGTMPGMDMGNMPGMDGGSGNPNQQPVVVPVAQTSDAGAQGERRGRDDRRYWRDRDDNGRPTTTTPATPSPAPSAPASPAPPTAPTVPTSPAAPTDPSAAPTNPATTPPVAGAPGVGTVAAGGKDGKNNGLDVLGRDCSKSKLPAHDGFQNSPACVSTQMGEVAAKDKLPSLLIVDSPRVVGMNQAFTLKVSTRNLVRDRFLGAKAGGYYLESSFLNGQGLQRGHFHTACRVLPSTREAPDSSVDPQFFLATEDGGGGTRPDVVTVPVPALGKPGIVQCTSWAGDGSHRTPMMTQANQTPAIDSVRIFVTRRNQPIRYDAAAANADAGKTDAAQAAQAGAQKPDANAPVPAAPDAKAAPSTTLDEAGNPLDEGVAAAAGDLAPPVADAPPNDPAATADDPAAPPTN